MIIQYSDDIRDSFEVVVRDITRRMREADYKELSATCGYPSVDSYADAAMIYPGPKFAALAGNKPVGVGGISEFYPNVGSLWMWATDDFSLVAKSATKQAKKTINQFFESGGHRLQCYAMCTHTNAHRWLELLGLELEHVVKGMGKGREDFYLYSKVI